jgi:hypothetical protein
MMSAEQLSVNERILRTRQKYSLLEDDTKNNECG